MFFRQKGGKELEKYRKLLWRQGKRPDMQKNEYAKKYSFYRNGENVGK